MEDESTENITPKKRVYRKRTVTTEADSAPKPRTRVPRKTTTEAPKKRAPRRVVEKKSDKETAYSKAEEVETNRKAPTVFASEQKASQKRKRRLITVAIMLFVGVGASAAVGLTDRGQINVQQTIEERNERIRSNTATVQDTVASNVELPVQNTPVEGGGRADGGLIGRGTGGSVPAVRAELDNGSSTVENASSTNIVASTTENKVSENAPVEGASASSTDSSE